MKKTTILMVLLAIIVIMAFGGCIQSKSSLTGKDNGNVSIIKGHDLKISEFETTQGLNKLSSAKEIRDFLKTNTARLSSEAVYGAPSPMVVPGATPAVQIGAPETVSAPSEIYGIVDYSKTNIQVEDVDEADFIKNDGKYIYLLVIDKLVIVDAFPAADARILSEITIDGKPRAILVNDNRLVVFTENNKESLFFPQYDYRPALRYFMETTALIYNITDRKKPELMANYSINGGYFRSRMIGDYVYFIVKDELYYYNDVLEMPSIKQGSVKVLSPDVYYFDNQELNYVLHTIASINIKSNGINAKSFLMGYSDNLYVSEKNIYITYPKNPPGRRYDEIELEERFFKVIVPKLPEDAQDKINEIKDSRLESFEKGAKISSIMEETYNRMSLKEKIDFITNAENAYLDYEYKLFSEREKTVIQKIRIYKGDIEYVTKGEVSGSLLNQFSMDEAGDYFRIATTSWILTRRSSVPYNNIYVMNKDLDVVGKLEQIAQEEQIYSTRFMGNRLYMVTFKRIDPLFVIDLSNPKEPKILGKLKIPGYSDYLHPYDENHIIGVGKETADNEWGGVSTKGVKLSLFDVSDVENPRQLFMYEIGKAGTDSEALLDHKAFLFDKKKNLLVVPISEIMEKEQYNSKYSHNMQRVWQGVYVFGISPADGFKLRGNISHFDGYEEPDYYWNSPSAVRRCMYMDDVLYTISSPKILMNSLDNLTKINSIDLPFDKNYFQEYRLR